MARYLLHNPVSLGVTVDLNKADLEDFYLDVEIPKDPNNGVFLNTFKEILKVIVNRIEKGYDLFYSWGSFKDSILYGAIERFIGKEYHPLDNTVTIKELFRILKSLEFEPFYWNGFSIHKDDDAVYVIMDEDNDNLPRLICYLNENTYYTVSYYQKGPDDKVDPEEIKSKREEFYSYFFEKDRVDHYLCDYSGHEYGDGTYNVTAGINANTGELVKFQPIVITNDSYDCEKAEYQIPYWIMLYDNFSKDVYDIKCSNGKILVIRVDSVTKPDNYNSDELDHEFKYIIVRYNSTLDWVQVYYNEIHDCTKENTGEWVSKPSFYHDYMVEYVDELNEINNLEKYYKIVKKAVKDLPEKAKQLIKLLGGKKRITVSDLNDLCDEYKPYSYLRSTYLTTEMKLILAKKLYVDRPIFAIKESTLERCNTDTDSNTKELMDNWQAQFPKDSIYVTYEAVYDLLVGDSKAANAQIMGKAYIGELDPFSYDPDTYEKAKRRKEAILNRVKPVVLKPGDISRENFVLFNDDFYCYPDTKVSFLVKERTVKFSKVDASRPFILPLLINEGKCWIRKSNASGLKPKALNSFYSMDDEAWSVEESKLKKKK